MKHTSRSPARKCLNPVCPKKSFAPVRTDQKFCSKECKNDYHNVQRRIRNREIYGLEKVIRENEKKLARLYNSPLYRDHAVPEELLAYEQIAMSVHSDTNMNKKTNRSILWSHAYGIEYTGTVPRVYVIHKR